MCMYVSVCESLCGGQMTPFMNWFFSLNQCSVFVCVCEVHIHSITKCILLYTLCFLSFLFLNTGIWTQCLYILDKNNSVMKLYPWFFLFFSFEGLTELFRVVLDSSVALMALNLQSFSLSLPSGGDHRHMCITNADCFLGCESLHVCQVLSASGFSVPLSFPASRSCLVW